MGPAALVHPAAPGLTRVGSAQGWTGSVAGGVAGLAVALATRLTGARPRLLAVVATVAGVALQLGTYAFLDSWTPQV